LKTSAKANLNIKEAFQELLKLDPKNSNLVIEGSSDGSKSEKSTSSGKIEKTKDGKKKCLVM
jgi:hypothetical protein